MACQSKSHSSPGSPAISPSLLANIRTPPPGWKPPRRFLLGLGPPWEPDHWECEDDDEDDWLAFASQSFESSETILMDSPSSKRMENSASTVVNPPPKRIKRDLKPTSQRFGSPVSSSKVEQIRKDGVPKATSKQTQWSLSVWKEWAAHRKENLIEESEFENPLCDDFGTNSVDCLKFWLPKFVADIRKIDETCYPPNSLYQICCGLQRSLASVDKAEVNIFTPKFVAHP